MSEPENPGEVPATGLQDFSLQPKSDKKEMDLESMSQDDLLALRAKIDSMLKGIHLNDLDLPKELMVQYALAKKLQEATLEGNDAPANQKAQVTNTCVNLLNTITKMQTEVFNSQRAKEMEMVLIKVLKTLPQEAQDAFFAEFEKESRATAT